MTDARYQRTHVDAFGDADELAELRRAVETAVAGRPLPDVVAVACMLIGNCVLMSAADRAHVHEGIDACARDIKDYVDGDIDAAALAAAEPAGHA